LGAASVRNTGSSNVIVPCTKPSQKARRTQPFVSFPSQIKNLFLEKQHWGEIAQNLLSFFDDRPPSPKSLFMPLLRYESWVPGHILGRNTQRRILFQSSPKLALISPSSPTPRRTNAEGSITFFSGPGWARHRVVKYFDW